MSPRTLFALASVTLIAMACARGKDANFDDDESDDEASSAGSGATTGANATATGSGETTSTAAGSGGTTSTGMTTSANTGPTSATTGAGGAGGDPTSNNAATGTTTASSGAGGNMNNCVHDVCTDGVALTFGCGDPCVDTVCFDDDYCCDAQFGAWDDICIEQAVDLCAAPCATGPAPGSLVITEIMNDPSSVSDAKGEWFEIYNPTAASVDLQGLVIRHQSLLVDPTATFTISASVLVSPGGYVVLGNNVDPVTNGGVTVDYLYAGANLANTADYLAIEEGNGALLDEVAWDAASGLDPVGKSRNLDPMNLNDVDNDDDTYFCEASSLMSGGDAGTPGQANDPCL